MFRQSTNKQSEPNNWNWLDERSVRFNQLHNSKRFSVSYTFICGVKSMTNSIHDVFASIYVAVTSVYDAMRLNFVHSLKANTIWIGDAVI